MGRRGEKEEERAGQEERKEKIAATAPSMRRIGVHTLFREQN
jgi:hypothetical protein